MPLGLLSLAANLNHKDVINIYKPNIRLIRKEDYKRVAIDILKSKPSLIGFSTWCISYAASLLVAKEIKLLKPTIPIVFGGPQASILSTETLEKFEFVDYVLCGEADFTFPEFLMELKKTKPDFSTIPGLCYRNDSNNIKQNRINGGVKNMDELPFPAYELTTLPNWIKLDVGRGCPYRCTYCATNDFFSNKYRVKSAKRIASEMMQAYKTKKINSFSFAHDMFTLNKKFVFDLCEKLIILKREKGIEFKWSCSARIDCVTKKMLIQMKMAGCRAIFFGIESGSGRMQKLIQKNLKVSAVYEIADICRNLGLDMHASFIIGLPEETKTDLNLTLHCALQLALKGVLIQASELSLLPGTPLFDNYKTNLKFDGNFSTFSRSFCGPEELNLIINYPSIFSSFYYLPVKTLQRPEMSFMGQIINSSSYFRNTLFLLSALIQSNLSKTNLVGLYKNSFNQLSIEEREQNSITSLWISVLHKTITHNHKNLQNPYVYDVFAYEAYLALLKTIFPGWNFMRTRQIISKFPENFILKPTPVWKTLTTSYKLEKIIPSENNWETRRIDIKKGRYRYLIVAVTEVKHKRIKLSKKEDFLLLQLSELSFAEYVKKVKPVSNYHESLLWVKRMKRLGVLEIREIPKSTE